MFYRKEDEGEERLNDLPKCTQLISAYYWSADSKPRVPSTLSRWLFLKEEFQVVLKGSGSQPVSTFTLTRWQYNHLCRERVKGLKKLLRELPQPPFTPSVCCIQVGSIAVRSYYNGQRTKRKDNCHLMIIQRAVANPLLLSSEPNQVFLFSM